MLRIIILIQCDICDEFMTQIAAAADPREPGFEDGDTMAHQMHQLRLLAEQHGWQALKDSTVHHCPSCLPD